MRLADSAATLALGRAIAPLVRAGDLIALSGDLGSGKTTLARGIIAGLGYAGDVASPSFALVHPYDDPAMRLPAVHADLYRLNHDAELDELGLDAWQMSAVLIVEWPDRLPVTWLSDALHLALAVRPDGARQLTARAGAAWTGRWPPRIPTHPT